MAKKKLVELKIVKASNNLIDANYKQFTLSAKQILWHIAARLQEEGYTPGSFQTHIVMAPYETILIDLETGKEEKTTASKCVKIRLDTKRLMLETGMNYTTLKDTVNLMKKANLWIIDKENRRRTITSIFPNASFIDGENQIEVFMWSDILLHLLQLQIWTQLDYNEIMKFKSQYSLRMYEMLCKVRNQEYAVFDKNLQELNEAFDTKYTRISAVVQKIIEKAKDELDANCKLSFEYKIKYENTGFGRPKASSITFYVKQNNTVQGKLI